MKSLNNYITEALIKKHVDRIECVDLGLPSGTLWATCNLGANNYWEAGNYYRWGDTKPAEKHIPYIFGYEDDEISKYNKKDNKTELDNQDDAAYVETRGKYKIPTVEQFKELIQYTTCKNVTSHRMPGWRFTSKTAKSKSIFLPCAGLMTDAESSGLSGIGTVIWKGDEVKLWASSLNTNSVDKYLSYVWADSFYIYLSSSPKIAEDQRKNALTIRPVLNK